MVDRPLLQHETAPHRPIVSSWQATCVAPIWLMSLVDWNVGAVVLGVAAILDWQSDENASACLNKDAIQKLVSSSEICVSLSFS